MGQLPVIVLSEVSQFNWECPLSRHEQIDHSRNWLNLCKTDISFLYGQLHLNESLQDWILQLPNVTKTSHRFGGTEFKVHGLEFMHTHGTSHLDIRLSKQDQERMLKEGKADPHRFAPQAGWVTFRIRSERDVEAAKELIRLAYDNAEKLMEAHVSKRNQKTS